MVRLLVRSSGPTSSRGMVQPLVLLRSQFHWNSTLSPRRANAKRGQGQRQATQPEGGQGHDDAEQTGDDHGIRAAA